MIDNIYIYKKLEFPDEMKPLPEKFEYNNLNFHCEYDKFGEIKFHTATDEIGLKHFITADEYRIKNSLHKAFNKMNGTNQGNYTDFLFSDVIQMIHYISKRYDMPLSCTFIRKIEIGVNVTLEELPIEYIKKVNSIQFTKNPENMRVSNRVYGKKIFLASYDIKLYDKTFETYHSNRKKIDKNIMRYEIVLKRKQLISKYINTLEELINFQKYGGLASFLLEKFYNLKFNTKYNIEELNNRELELYHAGSIIQYWLDLQKLNSNTAATKRQRYKKIITNLESKGKNQDSLLLELRQKIRLKIFLLSQEVPTCNITEKVTYKNKKNDSR